LKWHCQSDLKIIPPGPKIIGDVGRRKKRVNTFKRKASLINTQRNYFPGNLFNLVNLKKGFKVKPQKLGNFKKKTPGEIFKIVLGKR